MELSQPHQFGGNESLSQKPQFCKVLFPNPFAYMRIPPKFRRNLPHELPKLATLSGPHGTNWCLQIHQNGRDVFFKGGWLKFAKAHDLRTGYFLVFRYDGNMVFNVTIFDTTCCLKEYAQTPMQSSLHSFEIDDSSESSDERLSVKAHDAEMEISYDYLNKRKKLPNGKAQRVLEKKKSSTSQNKIMPRRNNVKFGSEQLLGEKLEGETRATKNSIGIKRKANMKAKEEFKKGKKRTLQKKELMKTINIIHDSTQYQKFEKIVTDAALKHNEINIAKHFFIKNGLVGKQNIFLKTKLDGKPREVRIFFKDYHVRICKGWTGFAKENGLKAGDRMVFKLISKDTFLIKVVSNTSESETRSKIRQKRTVDKQQVSKASKSESRSRHKHAVVKQQIPFRKSALESDISIIVRGYNLRRNYVYLPKSFCVKSKLTSSHDVILKDFKGNKWLVNFCNKGQRGRLNGKGWKKFCTENGLKEGDKCIFKLTVVGTIIAHVIKSELE